MLKQGVLPFQYEAEPTESGMTALAGLPAYLEMAIISGLADSIRRHLEVDAILGAEVVPFTSKSSRFGLKTTSQRLLRLFSKDFSLNLMNEIEV